MAIGQYSVLTFELMEVWSMTGLDPCTPSVYLYIRLCSVLCRVSPISARSPVGHDPILALVNSPYSAQEINIDIIGETRVRILRPPSEDYPTHPVAR